LVLRTILHCPLHPHVSMSRYIFTLIKAKRKKKNWSLGADWLVATGAYPGFCSMKRLGVFLLPLDGMLVHRRSKVSIAFLQHYSRQWYNFIWVAVGTLHEIKGMATELNKSGYIYARDKHAWGVRGNHYKLIKVALIAVYNRALKHNFGIDIKVLRWFSEKCLNFSSICPLAEQMPLIWIIIWKSLRRLSRIRLINKILSHKNLLNSHLAMNIVALIHRR